MNTITEDINFQAMDSSKQVNLTMMEIKEIVYQLEETIKRLGADIPASSANESTLQDDKIETLQHIISKLHS